MQYCRRYFLFILILLLPLVHFGQGDAYIIKDGSRYDSLRIGTPRYGSEYHYCNVKEDGAIVSYNAYDISAYGTKRG
ncbi:MAG: hypothetical protein JEZ03_10170 [Bacteroidales bacterium]|nr:hypothetical protein [Bacteroidales bacterium]